MEKQTMKQKAQTYWKKHKNELIVTTGLIVVAVASALGVEYYLNHPSLKRILEKTPTEELEEKRNSVHNEYLSHTENDEYRSGLWDLITIIDREIRSRYDISQEPIVPSYHREHGKNLYKPD